MKKGFVLAAAASCGLSLFACALHAPRTGLVVSDVTVVSPERTASLPHAYVRIVDGRIAEVSEQRLRGEVEIDGRGRYLIPGLIDSHVHLAVAPGFPAPMTSKQATAHPEIVAAALEQDPKSFLFFGFTTVIDLDGTAERTAQWNARELRPDAYFCSAVAAVNGQLRFVPFPYFSYGVAGDVQVLPVVDPALHTPDAIVARIAADGAKCVKTIYERGFTPTVEEVKPLVAAAHARKLPVFIHANRQRAQKFAVDVGADVIVHGMWRDPGEDVTLDAEAHAVLEAIFRGKMGYQPTTQVIVGLLEMTNKNYLSRADVTDVYPHALIGLYESAEGAAGTPLWLRLVGTDAQNGLRGTIERATEVTRVLARADAHLLFGSDTPSDLIYTNPPGLNGRLEMDNWIAAGVSLEKLFRALTIDNARMLRLQDHIGTVERGKTANLLLLRANPLQSVKAYDTIETVFLHGRPIERGELSARDASHTAGES